MKNKRRIAVITVFAAAGLILLSLPIVFFNQAKEAAYKMESTLEKHLGEEIIIQGDTLEVVDYSIFNEKLKLSNGTTMHYKMIKNKKDDR
jgi:hypothetical protein